MTAPAPGRDALPAVDLGVTLALVLQRLYPTEFALDKIQHLLSHPPTLAAIRAGKALAEIKRLWADDLAEFRKRREKFLIYR